MAGRRAVVARPVARLVSSDVSDLATSRALDQVTDAIHVLQATGRRDVVTYDLVIGLNRVRHGLGRPCVGYTVTPRLATLAFGHALSTQVNPRPDLEVWIDVVGSDMPGAIIEVF